MGNLHPQDESPATQGNYMLWGHLLPALPLIVGCPWFVCDNLLIRWRAWEVHLNSDYCQQCCRKTRGTDPPTIQTRGLPAAAPPEVPFPEPICPGNTRSSQTSFKKNPKQMFFLHINITRFLSTYSQEQKFLWVVFTLCQSLNSPPSAST